MSIEYSIEIKLFAKFDEANIMKILEKGLQRGFKYFDHIAGERYGDAPILNAQGAAKKIMKAYEDKSEYGPCVYTQRADIANPDEYDAITFWFHEADDGLLEFHMGAFGAPKKKTCYIDFDYYIRLCLDLVEDFQIMEVRTTMM